MMVFGNEFRGEKKVLMPNKLHPDDLGLCGSCGDTRLKIWFQVSVKIELFVLFFLNFHGFSKIKTAKKKTFIVFRCEKTVLVSRIEVKLAYLISLYCFKKNMN